MCAFFLHEVVFLQSNFNYLSKNKKDMKDIDYFVLKNQQENLGFNISCPITIMFVELKCTPCMSKIKFLVTLGKKEREKIKKRHKFLLQF